MPVHWIAHRGNVIAPQPERENHPEYVEDAILAGYDVMVDVWWNNDGFFLGNEQPSHLVQRDFLERNKEALWCRARDATSLSKLLEIPGIHVFIVEQDHVVLTSRGVPIVTHGRMVDSFCVCVLPERVRTYSEWHLRRCYGICSDFIAKYKETISALSSL